MHIAVSLSFQNVAPQSGGGGAPAVAQPDAPPQGGGGREPAGGGIMFLLPLLIMVPFLFMTFRRQKKEQEQRSKLKKGDRVVSQSGLVGELVELEERFAKVKLAPGTTVTMLASTVAPLDATPVAADKDLKDLKDAKAAADKK